MAKDLSLKELAAIVGRHVETLRKLARVNQLPGVYKVGGRWQITLEAMNRLRGLSRNHCAVCDVVDALYVLENNPDERMLCAKCHAKRKAKE